jgi:hypothetical protein
MSSILQAPHVDPVPPPYAPRIDRNASLPTSQLRDSDAASVRSLAPSYHSTATELPSYDSIPPLGLPRLRYAPGFIPVTLDPFSPSNFMNSSSVQRSNPARRQYENVANRRVEHGQMRDSLRETLASINMWSPPLSPTSPLQRVEQTYDSEDSSSGEDETPTPEPAAIESVDPHSYGLPRGAGSQTASTNRSMLLGYCPYIAPPASYITTPASPPMSPTGTVGMGPPVNPHEDPELVGHAAAERAKAQRLYREGIKREMAAQAIQQQLEEASLLEDNLTGLFGLPGVQQQKEWKQFKSNLMKSGKPGIVALRRLSSTGR